MVSVKGTTISMTRGDTLRVQIGIFRDGVPYTPDPEDAIRFAAKHSRFNMEKSSYEDESPLILRTIPNDTLVLELQPEDTHMLGFGNYDYDIQITMTDGCVDTFISGKLVLNPEVD